MVRGRAVRGWALGLVALGASAAVLWACGQAGRIHGTVTESLNSTALPGAFMGLTRTADSSYVASTCADVNGDYEFTGLTPDGYTVSAGDMAYQPKTANVTVTAGGDVDQGFVLDPIPANVKADVVSLDQSSGGKTGGWRSVQVRITYQMMCHDPVRLVVWAYGGSPTAKPYVIFDSGETTWWWAYSSYQDTTVSPNPTSSGYDTVETLRFPWDTTWVPNGAYTIKAALKCCDPHKDGVDENPDPAAETWVHWSGSPPTATADGVAGGTTVSISVVNVVITNYHAEDTPLPSHDKDAFLYDPDAASPLCNPSFEVTIDNWATEPMVIRVWMAATAWADTRPVPDYDPYVDLDVNAAGTYTLTWDGSNPGYPYWEGEWGTWSFDVDLYRLDATATWPIDHFYAKTHDGWSEDYDVLVDPVNHHVWWHCDETTTPPGYQFRCNYIVHSDESTQPTAVDLVTLKELAVKATRTGPVTLNTLHDNLITYPGSGYTTETDTLGTWRTVFTGQTATGAEHRRDGTNPRVLATNQKKTNPVIITDISADQDYERVADTGRTWNVVGVAGALNTSVTLTLTINPDTPDTRGALSWTGAVVDGTDKRKATVAVDNPAKHDLTVNVDGAPRQAIRVWPVWVTVGDFRGDNAQGQGVSPGNSITLPVGITLGTPATAAIGTCNGMELKGTVAPTGVSALSGVQLDFKRTAQRKTFWKNLADANWAVQSSVPAGSPDDGTNTDEDLHDGNDAVWVVDLPGIGAGTAGRDLAQQEVDMREWVELILNQGSNATAPMSGTTCSNTCSWYSIVNAMKSPTTGEWVRNGDRRNEIRPGALTIGVAPNE